MNRTTLLLLLYLAAHSILSAQEYNLSWAVQTEGSGNAWAESLKIDQQGNIYTAGYFIGSEGFSESTEFIASGNGHAVLLSKHTSEGSLAWTFSLDVDQDARIRCMDVDDEGNIYIGGTFQGVMDFDPSEEDHELLSPSVSNGFLAKYNTNGELSWARKLESEMGASTIYALDLDEHGAILATGRYEGSVDFDPNEGTDIHTAFSQTDIFILKWNTEAQHIWSKSVDGLYQDEAYAIQVDEDGNIFCAGYFSTSIDTDPGMGTSMLYSAGGMDVFFMKLTEHGEFLWAHQIEGSDNDRLYAMTVNGTNEIYLTGYFKGVADFDPGEPTYQLTAVVDSKDAFIAKYDGSGAFRWARSFGGVFDDLGNSIIADDEGVILAGQYWGEVDLNPGLEVSIFNSQDIMDIYFMKLNSEGEFQWAESIGGESTEYYPHVIYDNQGGLIMASSYSGTCDADPSGEELIMTANGYDVLIQKFDQTPLFISEPIREGILKASPCPTNGQTWLDMKSFEGQLSIRIFNSQGTLIKQFTPTSVGKRYPIYLDGSAGLYIIEVIEASGHSSSVKVLKQ